MQMTDICSRSQRSKQKILSLDRIFAFVGFFDGLIMGESPCLFLFQHEEMLARGL